MLENNDEYSTLNVLVGKRVQAIRLEMHLTQREFAKLCGFHRTYIGQIENAKKNISVKTVEQICKSLKMDVQEFFDFSKLQ